MPEGGTATTTSPSPRPTEAPVGRPFGGDGGTTTGWLAKIVLVGLVDAIAVAGLLIAIEAAAWGYVAVLAVTLVAVNIAYLPRRFVPMKYLLPGLFFLGVFALYPVLYTAYASTTNYGTGHVLTKGQAVDQIERQSIGRVEGAAAFDVTPLAGPDGSFAGFGLYDPETEVILLGTAEGVEELDAAGAELQVLTTTQRTFIVGVGDYTGVRPGAVDELPGYPADARNYTMPTAEGGEIRISGGTASEAGPTREYDPATDTVTDRNTGAVYRPVEGTFTAEDGSRLRPGFRVGVGFSNYADILSSDTIRSAFLRVLGWNIVFAVASVAVTFAAGLGLAMVLNEERMRGRKIYRSLVIVPYALPGFMTALVWRGLLNKTFGVNRWLGLDLGWLETPTLARFSLVLVNLWLGYPYMFLVCTGALQSIPTDLKEAAFVDGATGPTAFRKVTFPLLLTSVSPLLIASFAFNFNNFTIVYLVTGGGPRQGGETAGATDILLSWTYRIALGAEPKLQGFAAALSVVIFALVAVISAIGFKYTKTFEEVR